MSQAIIAFGSNLGDRKKNIMNAIKKMKESGLEPIKISTIIETKPHGYSEQNSFLNGACSVDTTLSPKKLLYELLSIEREMGRKRSIRWGPRNIDLDIIFYGDRIIHYSDLTIRHRDAHNRTFVMGPVSEIAPSFIHPVLGKTVHEIYKELTQKP